MNLASLIPLIIKTSIFLTVLSLGLRAAPQDATHLLRNPSLLFRSLLSMNIVMPVVAGVLMAAFNLHPAVKIALAALSISPVPPILPKKELKAGAGMSYTFGLLVSAALLAIIVTPLTLEIFGKVFDRPVHIAPLAVAMLVLKTVLAPMTVGILVRAMAPALADKMAKPVGSIAMVMLLAGALPVVFTAMPAIVSLIGNGTLLAIAAFTGLGLAAGHLLGGPKSDDRTALALSTASRHPGVAIAIAHANFPEQKLAAAAILLYLIVNVIVSIPYLKWRKRQLSTVADLPLPRNA